MLRSYKELMYTELELIFPSERVGEMSQEPKPVGLEGLPTLLKLTFAFVDSLALKCAIYGAGHC